MTHFSLPGNKAARRRGIRSVVTAWLLLLCLTPLMASENEVPAAFEQANLLYEQGDYPAAADAFLELIKGDQASAAVHFNRANTLYQMGDIGLALVEYHRALALDPRDPDIKANIQFTREKLGPNVTVPKTFWQKFMLQITLNEWTLLAALPYWIWTLTWVISLAWANHPAWIRPLRQFGGLCFVVTGLFLLMAAHERLGKEYAIVTSKEAVVRFGPFEESKSSHSLTDGLEVQLVDSKDDWRQIRDPRGQIGWVRENNLQLLPRLP